MTQLAWCDVPAVEPGPEVVIGPLRPGSPEAKSAGCKCSKQFNHGGKGAYSVSKATGHDHAEWLIDTRCNLHGKDLPT